MPTPQPLPAPPSDDTAARDAAARAAQAEALAGGRRATIAAGEDIARQDQLGRGLISQKKRQAAASNLLG